jgi:hypothetical protein
LQLAVTRLDKRRYETLVSRGDGVSFHVKGVGHMFAVPTISRISPSSRRSASSAAFGAASP